jgi:hypothetical protein
MDDATFCGDQGHDAGSFALIDKLLHSRRDCHEAVRLLGEQRSRGKQRSDYEFVIAHHLNALRASVRPRSYNFAVSGVFRGRLCERQGDEDGERKHSCRLYRIVRRPSIQVSTFRCRPTHE